MPSSREKIKVITSKEHIPSFEDIYYMYYRQLHFFTNSILNNEEESTDIVSDVFVKFYNSYNQFGSLPEVKSFLYTTAKNASLNYLRHQKVVRNKESEVESAIISNSSQEHFFDKMVFSEFISIVHQEVEKLPEKQREIFKMIYFENLTTEEIASQLNLAPDTIYNNRKRAVDKLKVIFKNKDFILYLTFLQTFLD